MCSTCGSKTYGQEQSEQRRIDVEKLDAVRSAREANARSKAKVR